MAVTSMKPLLDARVSFHVSACNICGREPIQEQVRESRTVNPKPQRCDHIKDPLYGRICDGMVTRIPQLQAEQRVILTGDFREDLKGFLPEIRDDLFGRFERDPNAILALAYWAKFNTGGHRDDEYSLGALLRRPHPGGFPSGHAIEQGALALIRAGIIRIEGSQSHMLVALKSPESFQE
jgi:hypothetical protein